RRSETGRRAGRLEREIQAVVRADAAHGHTWLSSRHSLEHGESRLFPDLYAWQSLCRSIHGSGTKGSERPRLRLPPRRVRPARGLAERESASSWAALSSGGTVSADYGESVESQAVAGVFAGEVCGLVWDLNGCRSNGCGIAGFVIMSVSGLIAEGTMTN